MKHANIVICGAGIAGVACAYYLSEKYKQGNIVLIDKLAPLSFTTAQSGENFREYWPQPCMNQFVSHSIDLMEALQTQHQNEFKMQYFGYDFISHEKGSRIFPDDPNLKSDVFAILDDPAQIHLQKPYLDSAVAQVVHINRGGALDVYALGSLLLNQAKSNGVKFVNAQITDIEKSQGMYDITVNDDVYRASQLIISAGPFTPELSNYLNIELPVYSIPQRKFVIPDPQNIIPRDMPFTIYADRQHLNWSDEERELISNDPQYSHLLDDFPAGLHIKPEGRNQIKMGWAFNTEPQDPTWDIDANLDFPDIVMRGATRFIPGLSAYLTSIPTPIVQFAGYYTRTDDNLPLIGKLDSGLFVVSALAGYGTMSACAAGLLCADYLNQSDLPAYAKYFSPQRFENPQLMREINSIKADGQL